MSEVSSLRTEDYNENLRLSHCGPQLQDHMEEFLRESNSFIGLSRGSPVKDRLRERKLQRRELERSIGKAILHAQELDYMQAKRAQNAAKAGAAQAGKSGKGSGKGMGLKSLSTGAFPPKRVNQETGEEETDPGYYDDGRISSVDDQLQTSIHKTPPPKGSSQRVGSRDPKTGGNKNIRRHLRDPAQENADYGVNVEREYTHANSLFPGSSHKTKYGEASVGQKPDAKSGASANVHMMGGTGSGGGLNVLGGTRYLLQGPEADGSHIKYMKYASRPTGNFPHPTIANVPGLPFMPVVDVSQEGEGLPSNFEKPCKCIGLPFMPVVDVSQEGEGLPSNFEKPCKSPFMPVVDVSQDGEGLPSNFEKPCKCLKG